jgi:hypothetical protein
MATTVESARVVGDQARAKILHRATLPSGEDWSPQGVAVSDAASRICVLGRGGGYPERHEVVCADILR